MIFKKKIKYALYAMSNTDKNVDFAMREKHSRITPTYILIYSSRHIRRGTEVAGEDLALLTEADEKWLVDCEHAVVAEYIAKHSEEVRKSQEKFIKEFSDELEKEKQRLEKADAEKQSE